MKLYFTKMHGLGNDFVVIDAINQQVRLSGAEIRFIADRHFGVGCDQLLLVEKPLTVGADFRYRIFNADGGEVAQCGNGARCFARFVRDKNMTAKDEICVDTNVGRLVLLYHEDHSVTVNMGVPRHSPQEIPLKSEQENTLYTVLVNGIEASFGAVSLGNPHAVLHVDEVRTAPVQTLGKALESHPVFPARANIGFMQIIDRGRIRLRVFERGAGETLACGSGACAAAVIGIERQLLDHRVEVQLPGGQLEISWQGRGTPVYMTGPAVSVFDGTLEIL
jgi:diaminopimelate epimerase